ncbi:MAG: sigma-70 family RNA polymerase sigma factor [Rhizobiaceae bacterium]
MSSDEITVLIGRVAMRDRDAFRDLYSRTSAKLFGVCLRVLKDRAEAEDALQEIYLKIWHNASRFGPSRYSPISWLVAVARNHAIDRLRARKPQGADFDTAYEVADDRPDPEQAAVNRSGERQIGDCLEELDNARQEAVRGAYLDGLSYQELAERHAVPLNTMRTWLRRSLMKLKECLEK